MAGQAQQQWPHHESWGYIDLWTGQTSLFCGLVEVALN